MVRPTPIDTDVCVVGAGPAGACHALRLAKLGHRVTLVERRPFPRKHLGESLTPGVPPLLESLGAEGVFAQAGRVPVRQVDVMWGAHHAPRIDPRASGNLVDRAQFDQALVEVAVRAGVTLLQPAHVQTQARDGNGWRLTVDTPSGPADLRARYLSFATGRAGTAVSARNPTGPRTVAVYGYWRGPGLSGIPRIQSGPEEWLWSVPLPDGTTNVLVFVDVARLGGLTGAHLAAWYRAEVMASRIIAAATAELDSDVRAAEATPFLDADPVDEWQIKVGDAACALDPLSSSGVQKAIQSAVAGALVVHTILRRPGSGNEAIRFYQESLARTARRHATWSANHYAEAMAAHSGDFWIARSAGAEPLVDELELAPPPADATLGLSADVRITEEPCLVGDFVETRAAVHHPRLEDPVVFVGGVELAPTLARLSRPLPATEIVRALAKGLPGDRAVALTSWLYRNGLLEVQAEPRPAALAAAR